jgi:hypothetical protein
VAVGTYEGERTASERNSAPGYGEAIEVGWETHLRMGQDVRFVLAAVGGGAIRIGREIARKHIRHLETVAINCDPKVQSFDEFDRRVYLGPDSGAETDTGGSPIVGGTLAGAAEPALQRIFQGATFVIIVGSLGGGAGSGALPYVLEVAARNAEVVSAFVVKPFRCEGARRSLADRAIARLEFVESFVEKRERGFASLRTLDNEGLVETQARVAFSRVSQHWASIIEDHIENSFLAPVESMLSALEISEAMIAGPSNRVPTVEAIPPAVAPPPPTVAPGLPSELPPVPGASDEVEVTFEIESAPRPPPNP